MLYHTCTPKVTLLGDANVPVAGAATGAVMVIPSNTQNLQQFDIHTLNTHRRHAIGTHEAAV
jgi:hypothetical protein